MDRGRNTPMVLNRNVTWRKADIDNLAHSTGMWTTTSARLANPPVRDRHSRRIYEDERAHLDRAEAQLGPRMANAFSAADN